MFGLCDCCVALIFIAIFLAGYALGAWCISKIKKIEIRFGRKQ